MLFKNKYKEAYENQKKILEDSINTTEQYKNLCVEVTEKYNQVIDKDLKEATIIIQKLQKQNNDLILEVAMYRSRFDEQMK